MLKDAGVALGDVPPPLEDAWPMRHALAVEDAPDEGRDPMHIPPPYVALPPLPGLDG